MPEISSQTPARGDYVQYDDGWVGQVRDVVGILQVAGLVSDNRRRGLKAGIVAYVPAGTARRFGERLMQLVRYQEIHWRPTHQALYVESWFSQGLGRAVLPKQHPFTQAAREAAEYVCLTKPEWTIMHRVVFGPR